MPFRVILRTAMLASACCLFIACTAKSEPEASRRQVSLTDRPAPGQVVAGRIQVDEERMVGGAADSAIGDYKIMNHEASFVVHDVGDSGVYIMNGGALLDADLWREGESWDLVYNYAPVVSSIYHMEAESVTVESAGGKGEGVEAVLRVDGYFRSADILSGVTGFQLNPRVEGLEGTTYYRLRPDTRVLEVETVVTNTSPTPMTFPAGDLHIPSDHFGDPFVLGAGFARSAMQRGSRMVGAVGERNEVSFGLVPAGGAEFDLSFPADLVIQKDMAVFLASQTKCEIGPQESCRWTRYAVVGESPSKILDAVENREGAAADVLDGKVVGSPSGKPVAGARVFAVLTDNPATVLDMAVTGDDGGFRLHAGAATHVTLHARPTDRGESALHPEAEPPVPAAEGYNAAPPLGIDVGAAPSSIELTMEEPAEVSMQLLDGEGGLLPGKFVFVTSGPLAGNKAFGESRAYGDDVSKAIAKVVWQAHADEVNVRIAPGTYEIAGGFGIAYELGWTPSVKLTAGEKKTVSLELVKALELDEWAQCDTHIHTSYSNHGRTSHTDRVITMAAEGLNCAAITDHDRIMDFQPLVRRLALEDRIFTFPALEVSTFLRGHINVYSLTPDPTKVNNGAIRWWEDGKNIPRLFDEMRAIGGRVIQINHGTGIGGFFTMVGYDPETGIGGPEFSPKFDVMELVNGKRLGEVPALRKIAFSLWDRGRKKTVVGVSDSHHRIPEPGYARTFVRVGSDWHDNMSEGPVLRGFLSMNAVVSSGVFAELSAGGAGSGSTVTGTTQNFQLRVAAPSWVNVRKADLIFNGEVTETFDISGRENDVVRLERELSLETPADGWYALEVTGDGDLWPLAPGAKPYAMTNPIFVDADGDGWTPPKTPPSEDDVGPAPKLKPDVHFGHNH